MPYRVERWKSNLASLSGLGGGPAHPETDGLIGLDFGPRGGVESLRFDSSSVTVASGAPIAPIPARLQIDRPAEFPASFTSTGLPPGLALDASTGVISGTPSAPGSYLPRIVASSPGRTVFTSLAFTVT